MADHPVQNWVRVNVLHPLFFDMCEEAYSRFLTISEKYTRTLKEEDIAEGRELEHAVVIAGIQAIVFAGMCVESAIYDYAAGQLGDSYVQDHLEKMDLLSKWIVIPQLVCGRKISKDTVAYASLKKLIQARNSLVHHKSSRFAGYDEKQLAKLKDDEKKFEEYVHNAYRALVLLSLELDHLIGVQFNPLRTFDENAYSSHEIPKNLEKVIDDCKRVFNRTARAH